MGTLGYKYFLSRNLGIIAVGNPPVNALNGLSLKSLMSVAEPVRTIGTPRAGGAAPFLVTIIARICRTIFKSFTVFLIEVF